MTTKAVTLKAKDAGQLIGKYISFPWSDGWEDWPQSGYLQGMCDGTDYVYFHLSDEPDLEPGTDADDLGGVGIRHNQETTFTVRVTP